MAKMGTQSRIHSNAIAYQEERHRFAFVQFGVLIVLVLIDDDKTPACSRELRHGVRLITESEPWIVPER
jgi:hypothetical protein